MPKLNGIDFDKRNPSERCQCTYYYLTCHNDFSFARAAIKYNVYEYLMKNELSQSDIERIAVRFLKPMIEQKEHSLIRNNFMNTLLGDLSFEENQFFRSARSLYLFIRCSLLCPCLGLSRTGAYVIILWIMKRFQIRFHFMMKITSPYLCVILMKKWILLKLSAKFLLSYCVHGIISAIWS